MTGWKRRPVNPVGYLETGVLYCDDNLQRLTEFPTDCVDLIYLDPPFFSNRHYEVIWGDEAEVRSFEDRWQGGINVYTDWMRERLIELQRVLKPTGTIYLHCDFHAGHYLKVLMDELFGMNRFLNEIVWHYKTSSGAPCARPGLTETPKPGFLPGRRELPSHATTEEVPR